MLMILVEIHGMRLALICCYAPTSQSTESQKDTFYHELRNVMKSIPSTHKAILCGDFNATIGTDVNNMYLCTGNALETHVITNDNGRRLLQFADESRLRLENTIRPSKDRLMSTWKSANGFEKRLDYILTSRVCRKYVTKCRVRRGSSKMYETDHFLIEMAIFVPKINKLVRENCRKSRKPRPCLEALNNREIRDKYEKELDEVFANEPAGNIDQMNDKICKGLGKATHSICPNLVEAARGRPWEDDELRRLMKHRQKVEADELRKLNHQIRRRRGMLINQFYERKANSINMAHEQREIAREFREMKNFNMHQNSTNNLIANEKLHKHFSDHFKRKEDLPMPPELVEPEKSCLKDCLNAAADVDQGPPTEHELLQHMAKLKNRKCMGVDGVKMESVKYGTGSIRFVKYIFFLITLIWSTVSIPIIWTTSKITCLFKKGSRTVAANYRGISITATLSRILPMIIMEQLRKAYNSGLNRAQCGFRENSSTDDAVFILRNIVNGSRGPLYCAFIDLTAAYDTIPRRFLFQALNVRLGAVHLVALLQSIYHQTTSKIKGFKLVFPVETGCRQGGIESPMIFNIYFDTVCRVLEHELKSELGDDFGIQFRYHIPTTATDREQRSRHPVSGKSACYSILYADDKILIFRTKEALQEGLVITERVFTRYGLTLSRKKTETMIFNGNDEDTYAQSLIQLGDHKIVNTTEFKYLGVMLSSINPQKLIQHRIASAIGKFAELKKVLTDHRVKCKTRGRYMDAFIRARMMYNAATWELNTGAVDKLEVEWVRLLRKTVKGGWKRRHAPPQGLSEEEKEAGNWDYGFVYSNADIYRLTGTKPLKAYQERRHLEWLAHCVRLDNSTLQKQTLFMEVAAQSGIRRKANRWVRIEKVVGMDKSQLWKMMRERSEFKRWIRDCYGLSG